MSRLSLFVRAMLVAVVASACSDAGPVGPDAEGGEPVRPGAKVHAIARATPLTEDATAEAVIGEDGGTLAVGGVTLRVPAGALETDTHVSMTVPASGFFQVEFQPHGLQFLAPVTIGFNMSGAASATARTHLSSLTVAYFEDALDGAGATTAEELFRLRVFGAHVVFQTTHFSGYVVVNGRGGAH